MNEFTRLTPEQGFHVHAWMRMLFDLTGTELLIFAVVYSYTRSGCGGVGGNRFFMEWTGASEDTVTRSLKNLEQAGLISANGAGRGQRKKYTICESVNAKLAAAGIEKNHPQNADTSHNNHPQNAGSQKTIPPAKCGYYHPQNAGTTTREMRVHHPQNAGSYQNREDIEYKPEIKNREGGASAPIHEEALPDIAARSMQPQGGHEVPTMQEVEAALRGMTVRPTADKISLCAGYFMDKMDNEQWRTRDWRGALMRYAARWVQRDNTPNHRPERKQVPFCQPGMKYKDPGECPF